MIFLLDRIELEQAIAGGISEFCRQQERCRQRKTPAILLAKLKSKQDRDRFNRYLYSKNGNIKAGRRVNEADIEQISGKRLVFIIDEAHRTTFWRYVAHHCQPFPMRFSLALPVHRLKKKTLRKFNHCHGFRQ